MEGEPGDRILLVTLPESGGDSGVLSQVLSLFDCL